MQKVVLFLICGGHSGGLVAVDLPMSCSTGTSFSHNNGMEGEVMGSRLIRCVCNLPIKNKIACTWLLCHHSHIVSSLGFVPVQVGLYSFLLFLENWRSLFWRGKDCKNMKLKLWSHGSLSCYYFTNSPIQDLFYGAHMWSLI